MAGRKTFVNNTRKDLVVVLYVRKGAEPSTPTDEKVRFDLPAGGREVVTYGNDSNIYLNGIKFTWEDDGARLMKRQMVAVRGSWWDDVMNTNSVITWNAVGRAAIVGSN